MHGLRLIVGALLFVVLQPLPAYAVWEYSLAAQLAMHDGFRATCGKIEPRLSPVLNDEWLQITQSNKLKTINAARKTQEYKNVYRLVLHEHLRRSWNDREEEAHACEEVYSQHNNKNTMADQWWWRDRSCTGVSLDSEGDSRCAAGPRVSISFGTTMPDRRISILRIAPSSDVSFPRAGTPVQQSDFPERVVPDSYVPGTWAIPDSVQFEWKEWPSAFPKESRSDRDLNNLRNYVDDIRTRVQNKHATIEVRSLIPSDITAKLVQSEWTAGSKSPSERSMKLFFIFMRDGVKLRWEQWHGSCIENYGGNNIDLPRDQLLSEGMVCNEAELKLRAN